jgi:hypothetical protein
MSEESPKPVETETEVVTSNDNFGDGPSIDTPSEVAESNPEPEVVMSNTDDDNVNLVAANNVRTSEAVNVGTVIYRLKDQTPKNVKALAMTIVPKRIHGLQDNDKAWAMNQEDAANVDNERYLNNWMFGIALQTGTSHYKARGFYDRILDDAVGRLWEQGLELEDGKTVTARKPIIQTSSTRRVLSGQAARDRAAGATGVGVTTRVPLPHTGVHFRLTPRSSQDLVDLDYQLALDRIRTGRETLGIMFQNSNIYHVKRVWDFIMESTSDINIQNFGDVDPGDFVRVTDLPILQWGMACTMFPDGYPLDLPCSAGIQICQHVEQVNLDLDKLLFIDGRGLSKSQRSRLGNATHKCSMHDLEEYQTNFISPFKRRVPISENCELVLKVPTVNEYITAGTEWIESLVQTAIGLFGGQEENEERIRGYVSRAIAMASLREYSHWIEEIIFDKNDVIPGRADIEDNLRTLSATPELADKALKTIQDFIEDCTVALVAIPNFACPKCEKDYVTDVHSKHPELVPLDMLKHFFQAKDLRLALHRQQVES